MFEIVHLIEQLQGDEYLKCIAICSPKMVDAHIWAMTLNTRILNSQIYFERYIDVIDKLEKPYKEKIIKLLLDVKNDNPKRFAEKVDLICKRIIDYIKTYIGTAKGVNEFIISTNKPFPYTIMSVKEKYASLNCFREENGPGYSSVNNAPLFDADGISIFYTNTDSEEIEVANYSIIKMEDAISAIKEFFETEELPKCIE